MVCKAIQLLVTWPLLTSCLFVLKSSATAVPHNEIRETKTTELSTITPAIVIRTTAETNASSTTVAGQVTSSAASSASITTTRTISTLMTSTSQPPGSTATGATNAAAQTHTASTFDTGSFIGGMVLAFSLTLVLFLGYKFFCSRQEVRYRTIEEHDAII
ncbi:porimin [Anguilla anguilla]|uniref:Transmembrane protein 123 n=1 Tax=Anguilla anguilla TaxID=7936 RepID=A0A0E9XF81_ANGAN|nr:porimin [Anguilla anguilla]KAG5844327.1 hypothetical protein ANANG_G00161330 [Anguilla anguilla]